MVAVKGREQEGITVAHRRLMEAMTPMQLGFAHVALIKLLQQSEYPEREAWKQHFKQLQTKADVAIFMAEAKLKINHSVDLKKTFRQAAFQNKLYRR